MRLFRNLAAVGIAAVLSASLAYADQVVNDTLRVQGAIVQSQADSTLGKGVNQIVITGTATAGVPSVSCGGASADTNCGVSIVGKGTTPVTVGTLCTISGVSPQTCNAQRGVVTTGSLSTAAATSASYTINDNQVSATSVIECVVNAYSGTISTNGNPVLEECVPGSGTITVSIRNVNAANALSGTVGIGFTVN